MPVAIGATRYSDSYDLLHAAFAIPIALALGLAAVLVARRARLTGSGLLTTRTGSRSAATGWALGVCGIALGSSALVAIAVYGLLTYLGER